MSSSIFDSLLNTVVYDNILADVDLQKALDMSDMIRSQAVTNQQAKASILKTIRQYPAFNSNNKNKVLKLWQTLQIIMMNSGLNFIKNFFYNLEFLKLLQQHISTVEEKRLTGQLEDYKDLRECLWKIYLDLKVYGNGKPIPPFTNINRILEPLEDKNCYPPSYLVDAQDSFDDLCKKLDAKTPGEWIESEYCLICNNQFGIFNRKHHCRNCGGVFCNDHSSHFIQLLDLGITERVRVCDDCYKMYTDKRTGGSGSGGKKKHKSKKNKRASYVDEQSFDEDLRKAIELSLKESEEMKERQNMKPANLDEEREFQTDDEIELPEEYANEDEEFKKAIEMSIREDKRRERNARREERRQNTQIEKSVTPEPEPETSQQPQSNQQLEVNIADLVKKMQEKDNTEQNISVEDSLLKAQRLKELIDKETNELELKYQMLQNLNKQVNNNTINYNTPLETKIHNIKNNIPEIEQPVKHKEVEIEEEEEEEEENPYAKYYQQPVPKIKKATPPKYVSPEPVVPKNTPAVEKRKSVLEQLNGLSFEESMPPEEDEEEQSEQEEEIEQNKNTNEKHINNVDFPTVPFVKPPVNKEISEDELEEEEEEAPMLIEF